MNRYEQIKVYEQITKFVRKKQYQNALRLMDAIELGRFKARTDQLGFVDVYMHTMRYEDARELLIPLYDVYPTCHVLYDLFLMSLKLHEPVQASEYLEEYKEKAPKDPQRLIMEYMLEKENGAGQHELITILKRLKQEEYTAKWGYELAKLYHKAGMKEECISECDDLIAWFGKGSIVNKAITLKQLYLGTATGPIDKVRETLKGNDKEDKADKLVEEVRKAFQDLYEDTTNKHMPDSETPASDEKIQKTENEEKTTKTQEPVTTEQKEEVIGIKKIRTAKTKEI